MNDVAVKESAPVAEWEGETGAEDIGSEDLNIPRIYLAQALSEPVKSGAMKEGSLYLNITEEVLAEPGEPLTIVPLIYSKEYLLWRDRNDNGGGIMARATKDPETGKHRWDKPNHEFTTKYGKPPKAVTYKTGTFVEDDGLKGWGSAFPDDPQSPPAASEHHNYIVLLPDHDDTVAAISLSRTQLARARNFNTMLKMSKHPIYHRAFAMISEDDKRDLGAFKNVRFRPIGVVDDSIKAFTEDLRDSFKQVNVTFEEVPDTEEDVPF
jgi:hypothetical protein